MSFGGRTNPFHVHIRQSPINRGVVGDETTYLRESSIRMDYSMYRGFSQSMYWVLNQPGRGKVLNAAELGHWKCEETSWILWYHWETSDINNFYWGIAVRFQLDQLDIFLVVSTYCWISVGYQLDVVYTRCSPVFLSTRTTGSMFEKLPQLRSLANTFQVYILYTWKTYSPGEKDQGRLQCDAHGGAHRRTMADLVTWDVILKGQWDTFYPLVMST